MDCRCVREATMLHRIMTVSPSLTIPQSLKHSTTLGLLCGVGAAFCWALGFVVARQGIMAGMSPFVVAMHRYVWPGLMLLPFVAANGFRDLGGIGWGRGFALALFGGLPLALWSYLGFLYVPLGHGGVIQPSSAALGGMLLARLVLKEPLPPRRIAGGLAIVAGLCTIGIEARYARSAAMASVAIFCSSWPAARSPPSACWSGCGVCRRCRRWRSPACCRSSPRRFCCWTTTISWLPDGMKNIALRSRHPRRTRRSRRHLSVHPRRRAAGRFARGFVSLAGAAFRAIERLHHPRRSPDAFAACRPSRCRHRLLVDAEG